MLTQKDIEYKPISVKELLVEMKDIATLVVDLAYAAVIFKDKSLAHEVIKLEREIDRLIYHLQINIMLAARDVEDAQALQSILRVAQVTDRISNAAGDIVYPILHGVEPHSLLLDGLKQLAEPFATVKVSSKSVLSKKKTNRLRLKTKLGVDILAIHRGEKWIVTPEEDMNIQADDDLIIRGGTTGVQKIRELAA